MSVRAARSVVSPAARVEVLSSRGVLKWSKVVGEVRTCSAPFVRPKFDYIQREKLYYTREEKGYRKKGARVVGLRRPGSPVIPLTDRTPGGKLKPEA